MDALSYSAEHDQFRTTARRFIEREIAPHHAQWEKDGVVSRELWRKAGEAGLLLAEEHREVLDALAHLPQRQRELIVLRYWSDLSEAETARTLGISIGAVKSGTSRARDAIAAVLARSGRTEGGTR